MQDSAPPSNLEMLATVARRLGPLNAQVAFVGGAVVALYLTEPGLPPVRTTRDVDVVVEVTSRRRYYAFSEKLRELGFYEDADSNVICRWRVEDIIVDVMPTDTTILGFSNRWYQQTLVTAQAMEVEPGLTIRLATPPLFLGTKAEAFLGRGKGDFLMSPDIEDIVTVLNGRRELVDEVKDAPEDLRDYLAAQFGQWLSDRDFYDALSGHLLPDTASQARVPLLIERVRNLALLL